MIRCIFAGHRDVCGVRVEDITEVLEEIIQYAESPIECFVGGMGKFDFVRSGSASAEKIIQEKEEDYQFSGTQKIAPVGYPTGVKISLSIYH